MIGKLEGKSVIASLTFRRKIVEKYFFNFDIFLSKDGNLAFWMLKHSNSLPFKHESISKYAFITKLKFEC